MKLIKTIKAIASKNKAEEEIGFLTEEDDKKWYNVYAPEDALDILLKDIIVKGNKVEFEFTDGKYQNFKLIELAKKSDSKSWADDMTNFGDLLTAAHEKGLLSITTEMIGEVDYEKKRAVFKATVKGNIYKGNTGDTTKDTYMGQGEFTGYGDAEGITNDKIQPHFIRMAETRSIVRALRWYTNNAAVAEEETGEEH